VLLDFHFETRGHTKIWLDRNFADGEFIDQLVDCDQLLARPDCQVVKNQRKIKVGRLSLTIAGCTYLLYIKRYNAFSLRYRLVSLVVPSGAVRSLRGAALLQSVGIRTVEPVAAVENRFLGVLSKSFFVTKEISGGKTADVYWLEDLASSSACHERQRRRNFLAGLASVFRSLHAAAIYHNDLKDANIMTVPHPDGISQIFYLLDLEGVQRCGRLSGKRRVKNLVQINRTLGRHLRSSEKLYFLIHYLGSAAPDRSLRKRLIQRILSESDRLDTAKGIVPGPEFARRETRKI
jgi:hypothetical protein